MRLISKLAMAGLAIVLAGGCAEPIGGSAFRHHTSKGFDYTLQGRQNPEGFTEYELPQNLDLQRKIKGGMGLEEEKDIKSIKAFPDGSSFVEFHEGKGLNSGEGLISECRYNTFSDKGRGSINGIMYVYPNKLFFDGGGTGWANLPRESIASIGYNATLIDLTVWGSGTIKLRMRDGKNYVVDLANPKEEKRMAKFLQDEWLGRK